MTDQVTIANRALSLLGEEDQLRDITDPGKAARTINAVWDIVRQQMLRQNVWNFATTRAALPAKAEVDLDAIWPYKFLFALPAAPRPYLRLIEIIAPKLPTRDYALQADGIACNSPGPLRIRYVFDRVETATWDALFVDAYSARLAWQIADRITGDKDRKADAWRAYRQAMFDAAAVDAIENPPIIEDEADDSWLMARFA